METYAISASDNQLMQSVRVESEMPYPTCGELVKCESATVAAMIAQDETGLRLDIENAKATLRYYIRMAAEYGNDTLLYVAEKHSRRANF